MNSVTVEVMHADPAVIDRTLEQRAKGGFPTIGIHSGSTEE